MKKSILLLAATTTLFLSSCNKDKKTTSTSASADSISVTPTDSLSTVTSKDDIVKSTLKNSKGEILDMTFNNTKDIATVVFNGETVELKGQRPASGIWYKNDHYELRGKGEEVELSKDGKVVFKK